jgi:hypothetical protein
MGDLLFDPVTRDLVIKDGDFVLTTDPSIQNGSIMRDAHCFSIQKPIFGIGLERVINSDLSVVNYEMNRWQQQCIQDGASQVNFKAYMVDKQANVDISVKYV